MRVARVGRRAGRRNRRVDRVYGGCAGKESRRGCADRSCRCRGGRVPTAVRCLAIPGGRSPAEEAADDPSEDRRRRLRRDRAPERSGSFADPVIGARKERDAAVRRLSEGGESQERNRAVQRSAFRRAQISADPGNIRFGRDSGSEERGDRGLPPFVGAFRPPTGSCPGPQICLRRIASVPGPFVSPRPFRRVQTEGAASASGCPRVSRSDRSVSKIGRRPRRALQAKIAAQRRCFVSGSV